MLRQLFSPSGGGGSLAVGLTSARIALPDTSGHARLVNDSGGRTFVAFGGASVVANTGTSMLLPAGRVETLRVPPGATHVAAITDSIVGGIGGKLYLTGGEGG